MSHSKAENGHRSLSSADQFREIFGAVMPITVVVLILQILLIETPAHMIFRFLLGALLVTGGLFLFLRGVQFGMLPLGETIGAELPKRGSMLFLLGFTFILGFVVTLAEPDVRVLAMQAATVSPELNRPLLIVAVALGVGIFLVMAMLRLFLRVPIGWLLGLGYLAILILWPFVPPEFVPLALDSGGVTTGPVTVPFILAIGLGVTAVMGGRSSFSDGFGMVGIASIGPILSVMLLGIFQR